jgi:hypothetical protein
MTVLPTWANGSKFRYSGSVSSGTLIEYGSDFHNKISVSASDYGILLRHFSKKEVSIGTSRTQRPSNSVGQWLVAHVTKTVIASYVGPILLAEGYAKVGSASDRIQFF